MSSINTDYDSLILQALRGPGGMTTGLVARACAPCVGRDKGEHSRFIRTRLLALQKAGKVRPMDQHKPVCWVRAVSRPE